MSKKLNLKSKMVAGAALVALSGVVPQPFMQQADAATAAISVVGTMAGGITLTAGSDVRFGSFVATSSAGNASIDTAGATAVSNAFFNGGVQGAGDISFAAGVSSKNVDITVSGFGSQALGGAGAAGEATLTKVFLGGPFGAAVTITGGTGTATATDTNVSIAGTTTDIDVGARVEWAGEYPQGTFAFPIIVTVVF